MATRAFTSVACTVCGCVCDDLRIVADGERIVQADGACELARPWFLNQTSQRGLRATLAGAAIDWATAYSLAAERLRAARSPLFYGLSRSTTEGQRAAVALADFLGGTIDTTASSGHAPSILALQQVGESTCTLGEAKQRADLVIFWGSDPDMTHPRHRERYCPANATLIVVDAEPTATAQCADLFLPIEPDRHADVFQTLRMLVRGLPCDSAPEWRDLANRLLAARFGIVFFGGGLTRGRLAHRTIEQLLQLVTDLNDHTEAETRRRFYARRMRRYGDVAGADSVLTWQTGYPFGVNFAAGYPRYNPGEFTAPDMLARGEIDAVVVLGGETVRDLPSAAFAKLETLSPIIIGGEPQNLPGELFLPTAHYGIHRAGTAYRLDEVAIPLPMLLESDAPSDAEVLNEIGRRLRC